MSNTYWLNGLSIDPLGSSIKNHSQHVTVEPKVMQVLVLLMERPGQVLLRQEIVEGVWQTSEGSDESLTRAISLLRKHLGDNQGPRKVIETIPKKGYRLIAKVEVDDEADGQPSTSQGDKSPASQHPKRVRILTLKNMLLVSLALTPVALFFHFFSHSDTKEPSYSHNVRIEAISFDEKESQMGKLALRLRNTLASVFLQNGISTTLASNSEGNSERFSVNTNLDRDGTVWRATVNLLDDASQMLIWSGDFSRDASKLNYFSDEIAAKSANIMRCVLQMRTDAFNAEAKVLAYYAQFCGAITISSMTNYSLLTDPIYSAEPDNVSAISIHAYALGQHALWAQNLSTEQRQALVEKSRTMISEIEEWTIDSAFKQFLLASSQAMSGNLADIEEKLVSAMSAGRMPDIVYQSYAYHLRLVGRFDEAINVYQDMLTVNPTHVENLIEMAWLHFTRLDPLTAHLYFDLAERYSPKADLLSIRKFQADVYLGNPQTAIDRINSSPDDSWRPSYANLQCVKAFARAQSSYEAVSSVKSTCSNSPLYWQVRMFALLGDLDYAFELARLPDFAAPGHTVILFYPDMAPFRQDPRFWQVAKENGLLDYWEATQHWPDFCQNETLTIPCNLAAEYVLNIRPH